jgi:lipopolysaccharide transport system permease protein
VTGARTATVVSVIGPTRPSRCAELQELWEHRELLYFLLWRDIRVRYKPTVLGAAWAIIQPVMTMVVFSVFFGHLARVPSDGLPYPVFVYAAILPWQLFASAMAGSASSLVGNRQLLTRVYFPRLIMPLAAVCPALVDFAASFVVLVGLMVYYGVAPGYGVVTLPLLVLFATVTAFAAGLWLGVLNIRYQDVRYVIPFIMQFWLFATPVAYPSSLVPEGWRTLYGLNPMAGVVEAFRWALLGTAGNLPPVVFVSALAVLALLWGGLQYFRRVERTFADLV